MDPDENEPGGVTQIPLIEDLVYNRSRPLQPPKKKVAGKKRGHYPPGYDPDTQDLFGGLPEPVDELAESPGDHSADTSAEEPIDTAPTLRQNKQHQNQQPHNKEPQDTLTQEMTSQLADILQDLSDNSQDV